MRPVIAPLLAVLSLMLVHVPARAEDPVPPLPYGISVSFTTANCMDCPPTVCAGVPVQMTVKGNFPSGCYSIRGFELLPLGAPIDVVRLSVFRCEEGPCTLAAVPFTRTLLLPPTVPGDHRITLMVGERTCSDTLAPPVVWSAEYLYTAQDTCGGPRETCVLPFLSGPRLGACAAIADAEGVAEVEFALSAGVPVAGLEGFIRTGGAAQVLGMRGVGAADGMQLLWEPVDQGVRWLLFGKQGQVIPAGRGVPVLRARVRLNTTSSGPQRAALTAPVTEASDSLGGRIALCPVGLPIAPAVVCPRNTNGCDVNGDGTANIRDLIAMVRCLRDPSACVPTNSVTDCDGDGASTLRDVICCARRILHPDRPDTLAPRRADDLALRFEPPVRVGDRFEVPLAMAHVEQLSDARLVLRYPAERFELLDASFLGDASGWLALSEPSGPGEVALALVRLEGPALDLPWRITLRLRPGMEPQGEVQVVGDEIVAVDGARLTTRLSGTTSEPLSAAGSARIGLAPARPNPSQDEARVALTLAQAADVDLAVHDLAGRRVATLHRGPLAAGTSEFVWDGRSASGEPARTGLYFVRARVAGMTWSQRLTLIRTP